MRLRTKVMLTCNSWICEYRVCANTKHTDRQTDWRHFTSEAKAAQDEAGVASSSLLTSLLRFNSSWPVAYSYTGQFMTPDDQHRVSTICILLSLQPQRPGLKNSPDYVFSFHLSSVLRSISYLPSTFYVFASPSLSLSLSFLFSKLSLRASEMTLSWDTKLPTVSGTLITT